MGGKPVGPFFLLFVGILCIFVFFEGYVNMIPFLDGTTDLRVSVKVKVELSLNSIY